MRSNYNQGSRQDRGSQSRNISRQDRGQKFGGRSTSENWRQPHQSNQGQYGSYQDQGFSGRGYNDHMSNDQMTSNSQFQSYGTPSQDWDTTRNTSEYGRGYNDQMNNDTGSQDFSGRSSFGQDRYSQQGSSFQNSYEPSRWDHERGDSRYQNQSSYGSQSGSGSNYGSRSRVTDYGSYGSGYGTRSSGNEDSYPSYGGNYGSASNTSSSYGSNYGSSGSNTGSGYGQSQSEGRYSGMGPKGYKRSDDRIKEDVCEALTHDSELDASNIDVEVKDGMVTLTGTVESRMAKRQAEDCVEHLSGVKDVTNNIRVEMSGISGTTGRSADRSSDRSERGNGSSLSSSSSSSSRKSAQ